MNKEALELFNKNYNNEGACKTLGDYMKTFEKSYKTGKKSINYLPWATVERLFRMQGGVIEEIKFDYNIPFSNTTTEANLEGVVTTITNESKALFIYLKATWQGETLEEYYPIFDSQSAKVVPVPDAQQCNASKQRGMVRLIARLSGIGLQMFENHDLQFNEEVENKKVEKEPEAPKKTVTKKREKPVPEPLLEEDVDINAMLSGGVVETPIVETPKVETPKVETPGVDTGFEKGTEEHSSKVLELKSYGSTHRELITQMRDSFGKSVLKDLTYNELETILNKVKEG